MSKTASWVGALFALLLATASHASAQDYDLGYDPKADPFEQYHEAIAEAQAQNKLVLVIAGGEWCRWCHALERFVSNDPDVERRLNDTFVVMKVYIGFDNYNDFFFSQLPPAKGAPHFWVISPEKEVLSSLSTAGFEAGKSGYSREAFLSFIDEWQTRLHSDNARFAATR
jgi:hypothetical protein